VILLLCLVSASQGEVVFDRRGDLTTSDARKSDNSFYDRYTIPVRAGERYRIDLESSDFDAYLSIETPDGQTQTNDDAASGNTNSRLEITIAVSGTLTIDANSLSANSTGSYRLRVDRISSGSGAAASTTSSSASSGATRQGASRQGAASSAAAASRASSSSSSSSDASGGGWIAGQLEPGDELHNDGSYIDVHTFEGRRGEVVTIRLESTDFDPYLFLLGPDDFKESNDDADGKNSRITTTLPANGTYRVVVNSYGEGAQSGAYRLLIDRAGSGSGARPTNVSRTADASAATITMGTPIDGALAPGDGTYSDGSYIDVYTFRGRSGQTVMLRLESTDFDPMLFLAGPGEFSESNDDAEGKNSIISTILPADGAYRVTVNSYGAGATPGRYRLTLAPGGSGTAPATGSAEGSRIQLGVPVAGRLGSGDATLTSGEFSDAYIIEARAGQAFAVDLSSAAFDPYLLVRGPGNFREDNDDFNDQRDRARVEFSAPEDGVYRIVATSYRSGEEGAYRLLVTDLASNRTVVSTPGPAGTEAAATNLVAGRALAGRLGANSGTLTSGEYRDLYTYRGRRGERLVIDLSSSEIDPYLMIRGQGLEEENDDAGDGNRNARLDVTLPRDGEYRVYATTYRPAEAGAYTIRMTSGSDAGTAEPARPTPATPTRPEPIRTNNEPPRSGLAEAPIGGTRVFGIFVGITDYPDDNDLPQCAEDARKFADVLRQARVSTPSQQRVLLDRAATIDGVRRAFRDLAPLAGPDDLFVFFYSGHGSQTEDLASSQERDRREESLVLYDRLLQDDELATLLNSINCRVQVIALDACFSGGFRDALTRPEQMGLFSSEEDLTSAIPEKFQAGGYLSHFVREGLLGAADENGDNRVIAGELSEYLYRQFASEATGVASETLEGASSYQHLVVDRGGVKVNDLLLALANVPSTLKFRAVPRPTSAGTAATPSASATSGTSGERTPRRENRSR
jgi:hypothetical protein